MAGSSELPIVFTNFTDDYGGDTNGDGASPIVRGGTGVTFSGPSGDDTISGSVFTNLDVGVQVEVLTALEITGNKFTKTNYAIYVETTSDADPFWGSLPCAPPFLTVVLAPGNWFGDLGYPGVHLDPSEFIGLAVPSEYGTLYSATTTLLGTAVDPTITTDNAINWAIYSCPVIPMPPFPVFPVDWRYPPPVDPFPRF